MIHLTLFNTEINFWWLVAGVLLLILLLRAIVDRNAPISCFHPAALVCTCFGIGYAPWLSGTAASLAASLGLAELAFLPRRGLLPEKALLPLVFSLTVFFYLAGLKAASVYLRRTGRKDPGEIVIDEVAGMFTAVCTAITGYALLLAYDAKTFLPYLSLSWLYLLALFLLFRLFDIWKPWIIGRIDRDVPGGQGVMLDDIVAGFFAGLAFLALFLALYFTGGFVEIYRLILPDFIQSPDGAAEQ